MHLIEVVDRGRRDEYLGTLGLQQSILESKLNSQSTHDTLIFTEHEPIYTFSRKTKSQTPVLQKAKNVLWCEISRGGEATFHGPGQIVAYPIFDLTKHGKDVHKFIRTLEEVVIIVLENLGFAGFRREGLTGVWINNAAGEPKKIASIGIGVRRWISYHGIALNINTDLDYFRAISPCGQDGEIVTSLEKLSLERSMVCPNYEEVREKFLQAFKNVFNFTAVTKPLWLKNKAPGAIGFDDTKRIIKSKGLVTVCEEAHCPNAGECWAHHTATFMIMGENCTRRCRFCSVQDGTLANLKPLNPQEPELIAKAVMELGLKHIVITSVDRDDLHDMGAVHFYNTAKAIKQTNPSCKVEFLIPDFQGKRNNLEIVLRDNYVDVLGHNVETVASLQKKVRPGASFNKSLNIIKWAKEISPTVRTKSGLMLGLGESNLEILETMDRLRDVDCDILTIGQYLQPTSKQLKVVRYIAPEEFGYFKIEGLARGFKYVESGPLVRSSYHAWSHIK